MLPVIKYSSSFTKNLSFWKPLLLMNCCIYFGIHNTQTSHILYCNLVFTSGTGGLRVLKTQNFDVGLCYRQLPKQSLMQGLQNEVFGTVTTQYPWDVDFVMVVLFLALWERTATLLLSHSAELSELSHGLILHENRKKGKGGTMACECQPERKARCLLGIWPLE